MLTLYTADTPNGQKITIALAELGLPHQVQHLNLSADEQHQPPFSDMSPNHKIPLLVDDGMPIFESGAILIHLADKAGRLLPASGAARSTVLQWLFLQVGSIGPMLGQLWFFRHGAGQGQPNEQALERYGRETMRLLGVFEARLRDTAYLAGDAYTIADIASFPWIRSYHELGVTLADYPALADWVARIEARAAVQRGLASAKP
ncbi:glutathione S-transferase family protein [Pseudoduganella violaceinigra]|uniref:glutathione S-transferase family protein n=1 Tax=Pseudoduganella violaceinigra TaxID=246602 RepID=UPI0004214F15|nr:glutathione binding-like protein [Pseudoduganella violaceinigra]